MKLLNIFVMTTYDIDKLIYKHYGECYLPVNYFYTEEDHRIFRDNNGYLLFNNLKRYDEQDHNYHIGKFWEGEYTGTIFPILVELHKDGHIPECILLEIL